MRSPADSPRPRRSSRVVRRVLVALAVPALLLTVRPLAAEADGGLQVVTVHRTPQGVSAVVGVDPAPLAALARDAAVVTPMPATSGSSPQPSGQGTQATVAPVLDLTAGTPLALVVDESAAGAGARVQTLNGSADLLLRIPSDTPVAVVADASPPRVLTRDGARPSDAITALTQLSTTPPPSTGDAATTTALDLAVQHLPPASAAVRVVVLTTPHGPPAGGGAERLADGLAAEGVVLGVVGTGSAGTSWRDVAARTGGTAAAAIPTDASAAYEDVLASLQGRYLVRFAPPAGASQVTLAVTSAGRRLTTVVGIPGATETPPAPAAAPASSPRTSSAVTGRILAGLVVLAVLLLGTVLLLRRRRRPHGPVTGVDEAPDVDPLPRTVDAATDIAALPGVRVFDLTDLERPTEIAPAAPVPWSVGPDGAGAPALVRVSPPPSVLPAQAADDDAEGDPARLEPAAEAEPEQPVAEAVPEPVAEQPVAEQPVA